MLYTGEQEMKQIRPGDIFEDRSGHREDVRTYKCHSAQLVELIKPSTYQKKMDMSFRTGKWKESCKSWVEPEWYFQRGFEVIEPEGKTAVYVGQHHLPTETIRCHFVPAEQVEEYYKKGFKTSLQVKYGELS
jgi:hypothetical protein